MGISADVAILGGGVAGLALALELRTAGIDAKVFERAERRRPGGLGLIVLAGGRAALDTFDLGEVFAGAGAPLASIELLAPDGTILRREGLSDAFGLRRSVLVDALGARLDPAGLHEESTFVGFEREEDGRAVAAHFDDGRQVRAQLFVGADGGRSRVRADLFPGSEIASLGVLEMVGLVQNAGVADPLQGRLRKVLAPEGGLAFGALPCGGGSLVWYLQFDPIRHPLVSSRAAEDKRSFATARLRGWPDWVHDILAATDWDQPRVWHTGDIDPLPALHRDNVVLIGDAAHPLSPFTSQGVNAALADARTLAALLRSGRPPDPRALAAWTVSRNAAIAPIRATGRCLAAKFLGAPAGGEPSIPLAF